MDEPEVTKSEKRRIRLQQLRKSLRMVFIFAAGVLAAMLGLWLYGLARPATPPMTAGDVSNVVNQVLASATPKPSNSEVVYQIIRPSLVLVEAEEKPIDGQAAYGLGTGTIIPAGGQVLTALHVVSGSSGIMLTFSDGTQAHGTIAQSDPNLDIAVIQPDKLPAKVVPATIGNPHVMQVGDEAYVVGNPFGLYDSMSAGVISGFDRTFKAETSNITLKGLIQVDAAINPGNSGGPLLNRYGEVVGVVEGLANPTTQNVFIGIGFAVPIDLAGGVFGLPPD